MGNNTTTKDASDDDRKAPLGVPEVTSSLGTDGPDLTRRRLVRGGAAAVPVILTLRSGTALAQASALYVTPWDLGLEPSDTCAGIPTGVPKFEATIVEPAQGTFGRSGQCKLGYTGYDTQGLDGKADVCCPPGTVLVTASSATSLAGTKLTF